MTFSQEHTNNSEFKTVYGEFIEIVDDMDDPPTDLESNFGDIHDWLTDMCKYEIPKKSISRYDFNVFEYEDKYTVAVNGVNISESRNKARIRIDFEPSNMYFPLPKSYFNQLTRNQLMAKIIKDLETFAKTKNFKSSFFVQAQSVWFAPTGNVIWSK